jgi:hypothetical protein
MYKFKKSGNGNTGLMVRTNENVEHERHCLFLMLRTHEDFDDDLLSNAITLKSN